MVSDKEAREKFVIAANRRTSSAIKAVANVAKLPVKGRRPADVTAIIGALHKALDGAESRLSSAKGAEPEFKLPE